MPSSRTLAWVAAVAAAWFFLFREGTAKVAEAPKVAPPDVGKRPTHAPKPTAKRPYTPPAAGSTTDVTYRPAAQQQTDREQAALKNFLDLSGTGTYRPPN